MNIIHYIKKPYCKFQPESSNHDLLKAIALMIMIIDHIGFFFFPKISLLRAIGRITVPIWFFLIGYNFKNINNSIKLLILAALFLQIISIIISKNISILNVLWTMVICKYILYYYQNIIYKVDWFFVTLISIIIYPITSLIFEYGSLAIIISIWGYNCRFNTESKIIGAITIAFLYCYIEIKEFKFDILESAICIIFANIIIYILYNYQFTILKIRKFFKYFINIGSRYSLFLYVSHIILFNLLKLKIAIS